jgi:membrane protease YdiL (CAAX protease family)
VPSLAPSFPPPAQGGSAARAAVIPWGLWATLGFSIAVAFAFFATQLLAALAVFAVRGTDGSPDAGVTLALPRANGLLLSVSTLLTTPICVALIVLFVRLRRGANAHEYLCWRAVSWATMGRWVLLGVAAVIVSDVSTVLAGRAQVPDFMVDAYRSAGFLPLFWIAVVFAAPLFEELFFRGFLFEGVRASRLGSPGAVALTALAWALLHVQYDAFDDAMIFVLGVFLGVARLRTGSTRVTCALHALWNLAATAEVALFLQRV